MKTSTFTPLFIHYIGVAFLWATIPLLSVQAQSCPFEIEVEATSNTNCSRGHGSEACFTVSGGITPYQLMVKQGSKIIPLGPFDESITKCVQNLTLGHHNLIVTDADSCITQQSFTIDAPNPLQLTALTQHPTDCTTIDGSICLNLSGGTPPYTIKQLKSASPYVELTEKSDLIENENFCWDNLIEGEYHLRIRDQKHCEFDTLIHLINLTNPITLATYTNHQNTYTNSDDELCVIITGGTPPYDVYINKTTIQYDIWYAYGRKEVKTSTIQNFEEGIEQCLSGIPSSRPPRSSGL